MKYMLLVNAGAIDEAGGAAEIVPSASVST